MSYDNNENRNKIRRKKVSSSSNQTSQKTSRPSSKKSLPKTSKKKDKFKFLRVSGIVMLVFLVVASAVGTGLVFSSLRDVKPVTEALLNEKTYQTTKILYSSGKLLSNAPSVNKKEPIPIKDMPDSIKKAIVAIEDERFYEHNGVDIKGLIRSVVKTLTGTKQGGSTIPMQVSKMLLTSNVQSIPRKIQDIYYAYEMSKTLTKDQILEAYLNNFFVGKGLAGVQAGAKGYFDKDAKDLTLAESALLAGATKYPFKYAAYNSAKLDGNETKEDVENKLLFFINTSDDLLDDPTTVELEMVDKLKNWGLLPKDDNDNTYKQLKAGTMVVRKAINNPDAKKRQEVVLKKMLDLGYITQEEHDKAVAEEIKIKLPKSQEKVSSSVEDLIESQVIDALMDRGNTRDEAYNMFYSGGLRITTTIDPNIQSSLEDTYEDNSNFPANRKGANGMPQPQSAMVILDYRTGHIKALVGGRHITGRKGTNRAIEPRQPGSTIKPLSVYTPVIDTLKQTQSTSYSDAKGGYQFKDNNEWNPNTTTKGRGSMSLRLALAKSSNTIAVKAAETLGSSYEEAVDVMIDYLKNFGISTIVDSNTANRGNNDRRFPALTLGGLTKGISPLEMAAAYGTLANGGTYVEPILFTTITTYDNQLLVKNTPDENRVVAPEVAYVLTDMLQAVITEGTGGAAKLSNRMPVAGKTGTTNNSLDAWFVGYTPYYVGATYIGDDGGIDPDTGKTIVRQKVPGTSGSAARLWATVMNKVHKNLDKIEFKKPDNIYFTKINLYDGGKSSFGSSAAFIKGTYPSKGYTSYSNVKPQSSEDNDEETPSNPDSGDGATPPDNSEDSTTPPNNSGGSATPPDNSGDGATPPDNSGGSATPPDNSGDGATPPDNSGGNTTLPDNSGGSTPTE